MNISQANETYASQANETYDRWYFRFLSYLGTVLLVLAIIAVGYWAMEVVLLTFAAVIWAVVLNRLCAAIHRWTGMPYIAVLIIILLAILGGGAALIFGTQQWIASQSEEVVTGFQSAQGKWTKWKEQNPTVQQFLNFLPNNGPDEFYRSFKQFIFGTFGFLGNAAYVFLAGAFFAADPYLYRNGVARFFYDAQRPKVLGFLDAAGHALFHWTMGQLFAMTVIAIATSVALLVLNVPGAIALGLLAGAISFIPNIGAIVAIIPAVILAAQQGASTAMWVVGIYVLIQTLESNLLTPLVQRHQVSLPPAILLFAQLLFGYVFGLIGVIVAAPLMAVTIVLLDYWYFPAVDKNESLVKEAAKPAVGSGGLSV